MFGKTVVKTEAEKRELIRLAKEQWDKLGANSHLVCSDEESYLSGIADSIEVQKTPLTPARELTAAETAELDGKLVMMRIFGDRADAENIPEWYKPIHEKEQRESFEKLLGPPRRAETWLENLVREALAKVVGNQSVPRRESDREPLAIMPKVAQLAAQEDASSDVSRFLSAFVNGDKKTQREIARELAAA